MDEERLKWVLKKIECVEGRLTERARGFVEEIREGYRLYGGKLSITEKQWQWLEELGKITG